MTASLTITVEVACATPAKQRVVHLDVPAGTTARQAVATADLQHEFPDLDLRELPLGIYGEVVADDCVLRAGDRVEIYRPLVNEPRESRRLQAERARRAAIARKARKGSR